MFIDSTTVDEEKNTETFNYKCPNKKCNNYGYKADEKKGSPAENNN